MPNNIDDISVLPRMREPSEKGRVFRLRWVLDLVSDSSRCYINLVFQNVDNGFVLIDSIPPELLSYFTVGSLCSGGRILNRSLGGAPLTISITSNENNILQEAQQAFSDEDFDLSLGGGRTQLYSDISRQQFCFVQELAEMKVVIPSFVIAGRYYFISTSLREAILSRRLDSLYHSCTLDEVERQATIHLKGAGNQGDAKVIARFAFDPFARARLGLCKNSLYAGRRSGFQRLKVDFPVNQEIRLRCRGKLSDHGEGGKTFVVFAIEGDNSRYPFDSLDVLYQQQVSSLDTQSEDADAFPAPTANHSRKMVLRAPSLGLVRHLLESTPLLENENDDAIQVRKIPVKDALLATEPTSYLVHEKEKVDLSSQPPDGYDRDVAKTDIRGKSGDGSDFECTLEMFIQMVTPLRNNPGTLKSSTGGHDVTITDFELVTSVVRGKKLTLKETYDHTEKNPRRCATVKFTCEGLFVCLVEIDQRQIPSGGCSTRVMVSREQIGNIFPDMCIQDYLDGKPLTSTIQELKQKGIALLRKKHPKDDNPGSQDLWRSKLLREILRVKGES